MSGFDTSRSALDFAEKLFEIFVLAPDAVPKEALPFFHHLYNDTMRIELDRTNAALSLLYAVNADEADRLAKQFVIITRLYSVPNDGTIRQLVSEGAIPALRKLRVAVLRKIELTKTRQ